MCFGADSCFGGGAAVARQAGSDFGVVNGPRSSLPFTVRGLGNPQFKPSRHNSQVAPCHLGIVSAQFTMGAAPSPFCSCAALPLLHVLDLAASLLHTHQKQTFNLRRGSPDGHQPVALHSDAVPRPLHAPASPGRLAPMYTTRKSRSIYSRVHLMGATPSPFTPVQRPPRSALLLYLTASLLRTPPKTNVQFTAGFT